MNLIVLFKSNVKPSPKQKKVTPLKESKTLHWCRVVTPRLNQLKNQHVLIDGLYECPGSSLVYKVTVIHQPELHSRA